MEQAVSSKASTQVLVDFTLKSKSFNRKDAKNAKKKKNQETTEHTEDTEQRKQKDHIQ